MIGMAQGRPRGWVKEEPRESVTNDNGSGIEYEMSYNI